MISFSCLERGRNEIFEIDSLSGTFYSNLLWHDFLSQLWYWWQNHSWTRNEFLQNPEREHFRIYIYVWNMSQRLCVSEGDIPSSDEKGLVFQKSHYGYEGEPHPQNWEKEHYDGDAKRLFIIPSMMTLCYQREKTMYVSLYMWLNIINMSWWKK